MSFEWTVVLFFSQLKLSMIIYNIFSDLLHRKGNVACLVNVDNQSSNSSIDTQRGTFCESDLYGFVFRYIIRICR